MSIEMTGLWEELVARPEFCGHQVKITIVDQSPVNDDWLESLHRMASNGVRVAQPADDSRDGIYEGPE